MRCPYCGGLNQERAVFCVNCGRDLRRAPTNTQQPRPPTPQQPVYPANSSSQSTSRGAVPSRPPGTPAQAARPGVRATPPVSRLFPTAESQSVGATPFLPPPAPEAPGPFPPRTMAQFNALLASGAQPYTVVESSLAAGKRKLVRIAFPASAGWQQAATLLQALRDLPDEKLDTIIVQGVRTQQPDIYAFTNGQLQFDSAARLGSQVNRRYIVETGNGFASDAVRFVINE